MAHKVKVLSFLAEKKKATEENKRVQYDFPDRFF